MTDGGSMDAELEACEQAALELANLGARVDAARADLAAATQAASTAEDALADEVADVVRLESVSLARLRAAFHGSRDADLAREEADVALATQALDRTRHEVAQAQARLEALELRRAAAQRVVATRPEVLRRREEWVRAQRPGVVAQLDVLAVRAGAAAAELREIDEALAAAHAAAGALSAAAGELSTARGWSTYDTFFGGGMFSSLAKYDRLDRATALLQTADQCLRVLGTELRDVGMADVPGLEIPEGRRFFDVWFDNIFSDWAVRESILKVVDQVAAMRRGVDEVLLDLAARRTAGQAAVERLAQEREATLEA